MKLFQYFWTSNDFHDFFLNYIKFMKISNYFEILRFSNESYGITMKIVNFYRVTTEAGKAGIAGKAGKLGVFWKKAGKAGK